MEIIKSPKESHQLYKTNQLYDTVCSKKVFMLAVNTTKIALIRNYNDFAHNQQVTILPLRSLWLEFYRIWFCNRNYVTT